MLSLYSKVSFNPSTQSRVRLGGLHDEASRGRDPEVEKPPRLDRQSEQGRLPCRLHIIPYSAFCILIAVQNCQNKHLMFAKLNYVLVTLFFLTSMIHTECSPQPHLRIQCRGRTQKMNYHCSLFWALISLALFRKCFLFLSCVSSFLPLFSCHVYNS